MKTTLLNSALALSSAFIFTIVFHECGHYVAALILGYDAILFHNRVVYEMLSAPEDEIWIAGAGLVLSLLQGIIAYNWVRRFPPNGFALWLLWMGITGVLAFMGDLMIGPLMPVGDIGKVYDILDVPPMIQIGIAIFSAMLLIIIFIFSARLFEPFVGEDLGGDKRKQGQWARNLIMFPLFTGLVLVTILHLPLTHGISLIRTVLPPFVILTIYGAFMGRKFSFSSFQAASNVHVKVSVLLVVLTIMGIVINRWMATGVSFPA
ncbi:MAG: hypothetical protein AAGC85_06915 [Bacteroidota bacterium]